MSTGLGQKPGHGATDTGTCSRNDGISAVESELIENH
jgi:hypothetical protein